MKLQIIGSGAIITTDASASALIDDRILVDCGAGTFKQLLKLNCNIEKIDTVLITHLHSDHFMDVPFMMLAAEKSPNNKQGLTIFLPEGGIGATYEIAKYLWNPEDDTKIWWPKNVRLIEYQNEKVFTKNNISIEPIKVIHGELKASGFIIEKDDKRIGFSGDSIMCEGVEKITEMTDYVVLDASCPKSGNTVHMGLDDIYKLCNEYPNKRIIATHMYKETKKIIRRNIPNLIVPNDGEIFEL